MWHVSHSIRSISSEQQTRHTSWTIVGLRRKPRILPWVNTQAEVSLRHPQVLGPSLTSATIRSFFNPSPSPTSTTIRPLSHHIYPGSFTWIFNSYGTIPLVGSLDRHSKGPPHRLSLPRKIQLSSRIARFTESVTLSDYPHVLNDPAPIFQWGIIMDSGGYLCTSIPTIRRYYLNSYEEITMCKSCGYGDPKYPCPQSQRYRAFMQLEIHQKKIAFEKL